MSTDLSGGPPMGEQPDTPAATEPDADVRTFLIADVRGYTAFTHAYGDEKAGALAARFAALVREAVTAAGGEVVELRGDEALCVFRSARQALRAAAELQTRFRERVNGQPAFPLGIGVGLDSGEAVPIEGGYRGGALNLAARLCSIAAPGQILATETVTSLARTLEGVRFTDRRRPVRMKGLEKPVRVIEVVPERELPPVPEAPMARARRRRWGLLMMGAGAVFLVAVAVVAVLQFTGNGDGEPEVLAHSGIGQLDPATGDVLDAVPLGPAPSTVAVGEGAAWVIDANDQTVARIDVNAPDEPQTFSTGSTPTDVAVGAGAVWVANMGRDQFPGSVSRLDPDSRAVVATIDLPFEPSGFIFGVGSGLSRQHLAVTRDAVWVINPDLTVSRIDPRTNRVVARVRGVAAENIAAGDGGVWIVDDGERIAEIDPGSNAVARRIKVDAESLATLTVGAGSVWVTDPVGGTVTRIEPAPDPDEVVQRTIPLDTWVGGIDFGDGAVWATNEIADKVYRIDPHTNRFRVVRGMTAPRGVAVGEGAAWVTTAGPPSSDAALPSSVCEEVFYGGDGEPQFLLVSDLPLRGGSGPHTRVMVDGIRFALERRNFKAGAYTVGYQSCDSSTAQGGVSDEYRCVLNAKAYARNLDVMAVIGAWNSFCTHFQLPFANEAPRGPLAMISPSNTGTGLTRPYPGWPPSELETMYPSGERNYTRIAAANHLQAVAMIELAQELGAERVFLLGDNDWDGMPADARKAARNLGLDVAGAAGWDAEARDFTRLARRIARSRPDAVAIFGLFERNEGALIRDLRDALGPEVPLIAGDAFMPSEGLVDLAGPAARGMYLGVYGLPNDELPPTGARFLEEFEAAHGGGATPSYTATYGAQAVEILLDAIARSDGTRSSVNRELRRTTVEDGILGDIRFDANGDLVEGPVTFFRAVGTQRPSAILAGSQGYAFDRVITARAALLR
jgi:branched-chain amino acid transport system substrate-binding protein